MTPATRAAIAAGALVVLGAGIALTHDTTAQAPSSARPVDTSTASAGGLPTCPIATLPAEAADTVRSIHSGGPYPFPRHDGVVFGNRERHLPDRAAGFYREYTVATPGAADRSTRRIVTGGTPPTHPPQYFYTGDHYDSFCAIVGADTVR